MIKDITIGQYFPGNSFIHKLDPRAKLIITFAALVEIFICKNFFSLGVVLAFSVASILISRISFKIVMKGLKVIYFIIVLTSLLQIFYNDDGTLLFEWWKLKVTTGGVFTAVFMAVRIFCLILVSSLLTYTTSPTTLTDGLERLLKIMNAQKARGADLESGNLTKRAKALIPIFIPLFVNSFRRAYELAFAMECRCYSGSGKRTRMKVMKMTWRDIVSFVFMAVMLTGIILLNHFFGAVI